MFTDVPIRQSFTSNENTQRQAAITTTNTRVNFPSWKSFAVAGTAFIRLWKHY